ncbi:hypothetical protein GCM10012287_46700 [Streptomyces daqingensis]|uniref:HNH domain-containing protein n=2 Tax=Streptomyces daqingensis TaxID=1472640 RepID=A0ABQ2MP92_9ACTN|nr:hypothetical protein GCM10012287_46700 [Streptomyces daqingensis]
MQRELREALTAQRRHETWASGIDFAAPRQATTTIALPGAGKTRAALSLLMINGQHRSSSRLSLWEKSLIDRTSASALQAQGLKLRAEPYAPRRMRVVTSDRERYRALSRRALAREQAGKHLERRVVSEDRRRRDSGSRKAVQIRSRGRCENPECLNPDLPYRTAAGQALLQVDHVDEHASGGRDHPSVMIALCPNCHANKTHGIDREEWTELFRAEAVRLDAEWATKGCSDERK